MITRLHRLFWSVYGRFAWDSLELPNQPRITATIVDILNARKVKAGEKVLDAGCGTGNYAITLAEAGYHVTGIDYSSGMLKSAQSKVTEAFAEKLLFQQMDMNVVLAFPDSSFDHVVSISTLWAVNEPLFTLAEFARVLKPDGTLIVLQVAKPEGVTAAIRNRIRHLKDKKFVTIALVTLKAILERTRITRYWTPMELLSLVLSTKNISVLSIDHGPPFIVTAIKIGTTNDAREHNL